MTDPWANATPVDYEALLEKHKAECDGQFEAGYHLFKVELVIDGKIQEGYMRHYEKEKRNLIVQNTPQVRQWLAKDFPKLASQPSFEIDADEFEKHIQELKHRYRHDSTAALHQHAIFRTLMAQNQESR